MSASIAADDAVAELVGGLLVGVPLAVDHGVIARVVLGLQLLGRDVLAGVPIELGDAVAHEHRRARGVRRAAAAVWYARRRGLA